MGGRVPGHHHVRQSVNNCDQGTVLAQNISTPQRLISCYLMVKLLHMSWLGLYELVPLSYGALSPR